MCCCLGLVAVPVLSDHARAVGLTVHMTTVEDGRWKLKHRACEAALCARDKPLKPAVRVCLPKRTLVHDDRALEKLEPERRSVNTSSRAVFPPRAGRRQS